MPGSKLRYLTEELDDIRLADRDRISDLGLIGRMAAIGGLTTGAALPVGGIPLLGMGGDPQFGRRALVGGALGTAGGAAAGTLLALLRAHREGRI